MVKVLVLKQWSNFYWELVSLESVRVIIDYHQGKRENIQHGCSCSSSTRWDILFQRRKKEEEDKKILLIPDEEIKKDKGNVSVNLQLQFDLHDQLPVGFIAAGGVWSKEPMAILAFHDAIKSIPFLPFYLCVNTG